MSLKLVLCSLYTPLYFAISGPCPPCSDSTQFFLGENCRKWFLCLFLSFKEKFKIVWQEDYHNVYAIILRKNVALYKLSIIKFVFSLNSPIWLYWHLEFLWLKTKILLQTEFLILRFFTMRIFIIFWWADSHYVSFDNQSWY